MIATIPRPARLLLMAAALAALLLALWAGLIRLGWGWPALAPRLPGLHGPIMVCGFMGTLIALERAVGLGKRWLLAAPAASALGTLLILLPRVPVLWSVLLFVAASLLLVVGLTTLVRLQPALFTITILLGSVLWLVGNVAWLFGAPIPIATLWWVGFLVITVAGERLELSRLLRLSRTVQTLFALSVGLMVAGMAVGLLLNYMWGVRLLGLGLMALAAWLLRYDIAWRRLKAGGVARFIALCLISGYVWLGFAGLLALVGPSAMAGPTYDALLHSIFVGFVFSMVFGHATIIFPAVLQIPMTYAPRFYSHLILLHVSLLLRVAGDLIPYWPARLWGGLLNALVILLFLGNIVLSAVQARRTAAQHPPTPARREPQAAARR